jgi:hypothetical protein
MSDEPQRPSLEDIAKAPTEIPQTDSDSGKKEERLLAHERDTFKVELGIVGRIFGGRSEKPGNISALVLLFSALFLVIAYGTQMYIDINVPDHHEITMSFDRIFGGMTSIITLILGYLFGSNGSNDSQK